MVCIYPRLKNSNTYKSFGLESDDLEIIGLCEGHEERTAEVILVYDAIIQCFEGSETIYTDGGNKINLARGEGVFIPKGTLITVTGTPVQGFHRGGVISFLPEILKEYNYKICGSSANLILSNNLTQKITNLEILSFINTFNPLLGINPDRTSILVKSKLIELLLLLEKKTSLNFLRTNHHASRSEKLTLITDIDISESITLDEMAKRLGLSLSTFKREFKKNFKEPAKQWLLKKKIEKAYYFLVTSSKSIKEIAADCGFSDSSHFIKIFKRTYGFSPGTLDRQQSDFLGQSITG